MGKYIRNAKTSKLNERYHQLKKEEERSVDPCRYVFDVFIYIYICVCICMCVCIYVCIHIYVCMYVCICICVCVYVCMYVYIYVCVSEVRGWMSKGTMSRPSSRFAIMFAQKALRICDFGKTDQMLTIALSVCFYIQFSFLFFSSPFLYPFPFLLSFSFLRWTMKEIKKGRNTERETERQRKREEVDGYGNRISLFLPLLHSSLRVLLHDFPSVF